MAEITRPEPTAFMRKICGELNYKVFKVFGAEHSDIQSDAIDAILIEAMQAQAAEDDRRLSLCEQYCGLMMDETIQGLCKDRERAEQQRDAAVALLRAAEDNPSVVLEMMPTWHDAVLALLKGQAE